MLITGHANLWFSEILAQLAQAPLVTSRGRQAREILHVTTTLPDATRRVLTVPWRRANPFFQVAEPVWILAGSADADWITTYNSQLRQYQDHGRPAFHGAYGHRLRKWLGFRLSDRLPTGRDQLADVLAQLQVDPGSRRACVVLHDPVRDNPDVVTNDRPCNIAATYTLRDGAVHAATFNRSNDLVLGLSFTNIVQFTTIQEFLAAALGVVAGGYTHFSTSLHVYADDQIAARLNDRAGGLAFDVYSYVAPTRMRPWHYAEEGWKTIAMLYNGLTLAEDACPYWRSVGQLLAAWRSLQDDDLGAAITQVAAAPAEDWAISALEFCHRWARRRERLDEFDWALSAAVDGRWPGDLYDYIVHDVAP